MFAVRSKTRLLVANCAKSECHRFKSSGFMKKVKDNQVPIWAGLSVIGLFHYNRIRSKQIADLEEAFSAGRLEKVDNSGSSLRVNAYNSLPLESLSRFVGDLSRRELPEWLRTFILRMYCRQFGVNLEEAVISDLSQYKTLNEFFRRRLKPECRPIDATAQIVAPCDGRVLHCGPISKDGQVEQVKGMTYSLEEFLGPVDVDCENLHQITMYLAPGDYHCFHSPVDWSVQFRRHFSGKLLSVRPSVATWMPKLFSQNERVVYLGKQRGNARFFAFAAVGATNVGSIIIDMDPDLVTNCEMAHPNDVKAKAWSPEQTVEKGQYFGEFNLGSTVVLIFQAPKKDFQFKVKPGERIQVGQSL